MSNILLSIIMPVYNASRYLTNTMNSIINQNQINIEVICIDDGSTDSSRNILNQYKYENIFVLHQDNLGASLARNKGISCAKGKYILFFDSDDLLEAHSLKACIDFLIEKDSDILVGNYNIINDNGENIGNINFNNIKYAFGKSNKRLYTYLIPPFPGNKIYKKDIIDKFDIKFSNVRIGQDLNFFLKYVSCINEVHFYNRIIANYRVTKGSISNSYDKRILDIFKSLDDIECFYNKYGKEREKHYLAFSKYGHLINQYSKLVKYKDKNIKNELKVIFEKQINMSKDMIRVKNMYEYFKFYKLQKYYFKTIHMLKI